MGNMLDKRKQASVRVVEYLGYLMLSPPRSAKLAVEVRY